MKRVTVWRAAVSVGFIAVATGSFPAPGIAASASSFALSTPSRPGRLTAELQAYMNARRQLGHFNGTVLVLQHGRPLISQGEGWAVFEHRVPATPATRYAVASITKQFTAAAILQLRDRGLLSLDDPICRYVAQCPASWAPVTIRHLLNHTSGILDYEEPRGLGEPDYISFVTRPDHIETALKEAAAAPLEFAPGSKFHYSNTGYILLARIVGKVSGQPYPQYLEQHVLAPAGMTDSLISRAQAMPRLAQGYRMKKVSLRLIATGQDLGDPSLVEPRVTGDMSGDHGDANLVATAADLARWMVALSSGKVVSARSFGEMTTPVLENYGFGLEIEERLGTRRIGHSGGLSGFISLLDYYPDKDLVVVVLSNLEGSRLAAVSRDLAAIALGQPYGVPRRHVIVELPSSALRPWVGDYTLPAGEAAVSIRNGFLEFRLPSGDTGALLPESATRFYLPRLGSDFVEGSVEFAPPQPGRRATLRIRYRKTDLTGQKK